jgi:pyroglutamyl-peptidase
VCNTLLYSALHFCACEGLPTRCGFVHLPALPEQLAPNATVTGMPLARQLAGIQALIRAVAAV